MGQGAGLGAAGRITFQWYPGRAPDTAQEVTVTFSERPGGALVELVHTGWEKFGDQTQAQRDNYDTGWDYVWAGTSAWPRTN